ncbi:hypothetical protein ACFQMA_19675 [Halosimplex aquaticum]|uniref:MarR family transcriptional regulator n=1 Tax=Halosimplex aquaticum TaxID=3026162 RepID=A0ABD5Y484_9EURY|nr:phage repressor protein [Halosimplex aquaticum]
MTGSAEDSDEMHRRVDWLKPSDRVILAEIGKYGGWMKPATLALNIGYTRGHIARRCQTLAEKGFLEKHEETAAYQLTKLGKDFLNDELEPEDLTTDSQ